MGTIWDGGQFVFSSHHSRWILHISVQYSELCTVLIYCSPYCWIWLNLVDFTLFLKTYAKWTLFILGKCVTHANWILQMLVDNYFACWILLVLLGKYFFLTLVEYYSRYLNITQTSEYYSHLMTNSIILLIVLNITHIIYLR